MTNSQEKAFTIVPYCKLGPDHSGFDDVVTGNLFGVFYNLLRPVAKASNIPGATTARDFVLNNYSLPGKGNGMIFHGLAELRRALTNQTALTGPQRNGLENYVADLQMTDDGLICFGGDSKKTIGRYNLIKENDTART
jgi:hypothetical protein